MTVTDIQLAARQPVNEPASTSREQLSRSMNQPLFTEPVR